MTTYYIFNKDSKKHYTNTLGKSVLHTLLQSLREQQLQNNRNVIIDVTGDNHD